MDSPRPGVDGCSGPCADLENLHASGAQRFSPSGSRNSADIAMAALVLRRVDHVVVFSDDGVFISLHVHILEMNGESYHIKHSRQNAASLAPDGAWVAPATVLIPPACLLHGCMGDILPEQLARTLALTNGPGGALLLRPTGPTSHRP